MTPTRNTTRPTRVAALLLLPLGLLVGCSGGSTTQGTQPEVKTEVTGKEGSKVYQSSVGGDPGDTKNASSR